MLRISAHLLIFIINNNILFIAFFVFVLIIEVDLFKQFNCDGLFVSTDLEKSKSNAHHSHSSRHRLTLKCLKRAAT